MMRLFISLHFILDFNKFLHVYICVCVLLLRVCVVALCVLLRCVCCCGEPCSCAALRFVARVWCKLHLCSSLFYSSFSIRSSFFSKDNTQMLPVFARLAFPAHGSTYLLWKQACIK